MIRKNISSGSPFEKPIGFSRAVGIGNISVLEKRIEEIATRMEDMEATIQDLRLRLEFLEADTIPVANRQLIALLDDWLAEEDDLGDECWQQERRS